MHITKVWAENFRSFGPRREVPLAGLTLLIGPNNVGKSNVLDVFTALRVAVGRVPWYEVYGARLRMGSPVFGVGLEFAEGEDHGSYEIHWNSSSGASESFHAPDIHGTWNSGRSTLPDLAQERPESSAGRLVSTLNTYAIWRASPGVIAAATPVRKQLIVGSSGEGAAAVLDHLRDFYPQQFDALQEDLKRCAPEVTSVAAVATDELGHKEIVFRERSGIAIRASQSAEGLRVLLFALLILHSPQPPSLMAFEEIEHGVHPRRIADMIGFLRELTASESRPPVQIICTTHSPLVLDQFRDTPEEVVVVERDADDTTICTPLRERLDRLDGASPDAALGDLWYSGVLGGNPKS